MITLDEVKAVFSRVTDIVPLKAGGQKEVCKGNMLGREVVLKIFLPHDGSEQRARRELDVVKQLSLPYVPRIIESGECKLAGSDRIYLIEEMVDGVSYRDELDKNPIQPLDSVLKLIQALLIAAAEFERGGLVHRDLKPDNIMLDRNGRYWILDFGIARCLNLSSLTPTGGYGLGTFGYAPPEQYRNFKTEIDGRADLFAIGIIAHEALTGSHFYWLGCDDIITVINRMDRVDLPRLALPEDPSNELSDFIATLTQRFASRRPRTAAAALEWFEPIFSRLGGAQQ